MAIQVLFWVSFTLDLNRLVRFCFNMVHDSLFPINCMLPA